MLKNGLARGTSNHYPGSLSELVIFKIFKNWNAGELKKNTEEVKVRIMVYFQQSYQIYGASYQIIIPRHTGDRAKNYTEEKNQDTL